MTIIFFEDIAQLSMIIIMLNFLFFHTVGVIMMANNSKMVLTVDSIDFKIHQIVAYSSMLHYVMPIILILGALISIVIIIYELLVLE